MNDKQVYSISVAQHMLVDMKPQDMQLYNCHPRTDLRALQVDIASKATLITLSEHAHDEDHTRSLTGHT